VVTTDSRGTVKLKPRGTSDARLNLDGDTRLGIVLLTVQAVRQWQLLDNNLSAERRKPPALDRSRCLLR
jgi:hypothetical protein